VGPKGIVTIDGPAGAGKSTVGRLLAQSLGFLYLDSGALYRAVALKAAQSGLDLGDAAALDDFLSGFKPELQADGAGFHLFMDGREVSAELRTPEVSRGASVVAKLPAVRRWVKEHLKFYLDAALSTRARRRQKDWRGGDDPPSLEETRRELAARDRQDESRNEAPLRVPQGAKVIDTTELTVEQVVARCLQEMENQG
jgi:cytidylate kinase